MDFSLFLNTRNRLGLLKDLLCSIEQTTNDLSQVEVIISVDVDDPLSIDFLKSYHKIPNLTVCIQDRPSNLHESINKMAAISTGDFLLVLNDDVVFRTQSWDKAILSEVDKDKILYLKTFDTSIDKTNSCEYSSFPMLTRPAYEALGFFMSERFVSHGGDVHLWRIFNDADCILDIPLFLDHIMHNSIEKIKGLQDEQTAREAIELTFSTYINCWEEDITEDVSRIIQACGI
jgi:glycosyltransferase involved in cell wall biosynthesis